MSDVGAVGGAAGSANPMTWSVNSPNRECSNSVRIGIRTPNRSPAARTRVPAITDCPPRVKKESSGPIPPFFSTCSQTAAIRRSWPGGVFGTESMGVASPHLAA